MSACLSGCSKFGRLEKRGFTVVNVGQAGAPARGARTGTVHGGVVVWARSLDRTSPEQYSFILDSDTDSHPAKLTNGTWQFHAVRWDGGTEHMQGDVRCGSVTRTFDGSKITDDVDIAVIKDCQDDEDFFGDATLMTASNVPRSLKLVACLAQPSSFDGDSNCSTDLGDFGSYKIVFGTKAALLPGDATISPDRTLESGCLGPSSSFGINTGLQIPMGNGGGSPMWTEIRAFTNASCSAGEVDYVFSHGLAHGEDSSGEYYPVPGTAAGSPNGIFLEHGDMPAPTITGVTPAVGGWGGGYLVTVSGTNFRVTPWPTAVMIGSHLCPVQNVNSTSITCIPENTTDSSELGSNLDVTVINPDNDDATLASSFQYVDDGMGNGADGNLIVNADMTVSATIDNDRVFSAQRRVNAIANSGGHSTFTLDGAVASADFAVGDEVMWHVTAAGSTSSCSASIVTVGSFGFARVVSLSSTVPALPTMEIDTIPTNFGTPNNTNLAKAAAHTNASSAFCIMQVVRVPNFLDAYFNPSGAEARVLAAPFDFATGVGGIVAMRVAGKYEVSSNTYNSGLSAEGAGFAGGAAGKQGDSHHGTGSTTTAQSFSEGGGASASTGGGGGAHEANGGSGGGLSNAGTFTTTGCVPGGGCAQLGAGGGGGLSTSGGAGGGVALLYARQFTSGSGPTFSIYGMGASASSDATSGGGGGAGGSVLVQTTGNDSQTFGLYSYGGSGSGGSVAGGGGGAGGTAQLRYCTAFSSTAVQFGNGGSAGGAATLAGGTGGDGFTAADAGNRKQGIATGSEHCRTTALP